MGKRSIVLATLVSAALVLAGCKSDSTSPTTSANLAGSYTLQSLTQAGVTLTPPAATGTLTLTATTYAVNLTITLPGQQPLQEQDAGTYTISGSQWSQSSTTIGIQSVGTYTYSNGTLSVNVTTAGLQVATTWKKQ